MLGSAQPVPFRALISDGRAGGVLSVGTALLEVARCVLNGHGKTALHTLPALGLALVEELDALFPSIRKQMVERGERLQRRLDELLGDGRSICLVPALLTPAPRHHENLLRFTDATQTGLFNVMQLPATAIPMGRAANGLPLGIGSRWLQAADGTTFDYFE